MSRRPARSRWALPAVIAAILLLASLVPLPDGQMAPTVVPLGITTWLHLMGYAALAASLLGAFQPAEAPGTTPQNTLLAVTAAMALGTGIEVAQIAVPGRAFAVTDLLANAVGVAVGVVLRR